MDAGDVRVPVSLDLSQFARGADGVEKTLGGVGSAADRTRARLDGLGGATRQSAQGVAKMSGNLGAANRTLLDFGRFTNDSIQFQYGLRQGLVATANQIEGLGQGFRAMKAQAEASGTTMRTQLLGALKGGGGIILALNLAATAAVLFGDKIVAAFSDAGDAAQGAKSDIDDALDSLIKFKSLERGFEFGNFNEGFAELSRQSALMARARAELARAQQAAGTRFAGSGSGGTGGQGAVVRVQIETDETRAAQQEVDNIAAGIARIQEGLTRIRREGGLADSLGAPSTASEGRGRAGGGRSAGGPMSRLRQEVEEVTLSTEKMAAAQRRAQDEVKATARAFQQIVATTTGRGPAGLQPLDVEAIRSARIEAEAARIAFLGIDRAVTNVSSGDGGGITKLRTETQLAGIAARQLSEGIADAALRLGGAGFTSIFGGGASARDEREAERERERLRELFEAGRIGAEELRDELDMVDERLRALGGTGVSVGTVLSDVFGTLVNSMARAAAQALVLQGILRLFGLPTGGGFVQTFTGLLGGPSASAVAAPSASALAFGPPRVSGGMLQIPVAAVSQAGDAGAARLRRIGQGR